MFFFFFTGNVKLQCDNEIANATNNVTMTQKSKGYYLFRCDVIGSVKLIWETSHSPSFPVASFTPTGYFFEDDINYVIEKIEVGDNETDTNFTSYIWFYSEDFQPSFVLCASAEFSTMAAFGDYIYIFSLAL